jgi:hypothetical protein
VLNASEYRRRLVGLWKDPSCFNFEDPEAKKRLDEVRNLRNLYI